MSNSNPTTEIWTTDPKYENLPYKNISINLSTYQQ